jgi:hypothetical protein
MDLRASTRLLAACYVALGILGFVDSAFANTWELPAALGFLFLLAGWFADSGPFPIGAGLGGLAALADIIVFFDWDKNSDGDWALATATLVVAGLALLALANALMRRRREGVSDTTPTTPAAA